MYRLTTRMMQQLERDLGAYHDMFMGDRCKGWELEELLVRAIKADNRAQHHVQWKEKGHDDEADLRIRTNGSMHLIQVKSGKWSNKRAVLDLSGHRLGRFKADFAEITDYLNNPSADLLSVPCEISDDNGRTFAYEVAYIPRKYLTRLTPGKWEKVGAQWRQTNEYGVKFSIHPSMSWQIWWRIPAEFIDVGGAFSIA